MIYLLQNPGPIGNATTDFLPREPRKLGDAPRCPVCNRFVAMLRWRAPYRVELTTWGSTFGDIAFGPGDSLLVSERFATLWRADALVGLEGFEDVEIVDVHRRGKMAAKPPHYFRVSVALSEVAVDQKLSGVEWSEAPTCSSCRLGDNLNGWRRIELEGSAAENVFIARGLPGQVIVDERFRLFCEENQIANARLVPGAEAGLWFSNERNGRS